jgi:PBS lyase HEAT-like repeat
MHDLQFSQAVSRLLEIGSISRREGRIDYAAEFGIRPSDVDELLRMAESPHLNMCDQDSAEVWAPIHAIRALGQLHAAETVPRLIRLIDEYKDDDWFREELPEVFEEIGPGAIPPLREALADSRNTRRCRTTASEGLAKIGTRYAECYSDAVAGIASVLEQTDRTQAELNGFLVSDLLELKAVETLPLLERVFRENRVDHWIVDWGSVRDELGIDAPDPSPKGFIDSRPGRVRRPPQSPWPGRTPPKPDDVRSEQKDRRQSRKRQRKAKAKARRASKRKR